MISWTVGSATNADVDEALKCRRLVFVILISINIYSQGSCSGVFQFHFTSFENDRGRDSVGRCCDGGGGEGSGGGGASDASGPCRSPCRTFFSLCLRHFQHRLPSTTADLQCTYGENTTEAIGQNSFRDSADDDDTYLVEMPFDFTWPGSFSLVIKAWHDPTNVGPSEGSKRTLIGEYSIKQSLNVSEDWRQNVYVSQRSRLAFRYRVVCNVNYIGPGCSEKCTPRDDKLGHYTCSQNTSKACLPGWTGEYCQTAICLDGCNTTNGFCDQPYECRCRLGWQGRLCNECVPYPGCLHGGCSNRWQCNCFEGWGGLFCNQDLNFCTNNAPCQNGATCKNTGEGSYSCFCPIGFTGTNCEIEVFDCHRNECINNGVCEKLNGGSHRCRCPKGYSGRRCETTARSCRDKPCRHEGVCHSVGDDDDEQTTAGYRCQCSPGYTGSNCEVDVDECASSPCQNGGRCIDEGGRYICACSAGFTGDRCERDRNDCVDSPCLNGGSCRDDVDRFRCHCAAGFTGDLCQDNVDDCLTAPCANGATCVDADNAVVCRCAGGFTGRDCSARVDECRSSPCGVGGVCRDRMNGYRCHCHPGFEGTNCELRLDTPRSSWPGETRVDINGNNNNNASESTTSGSSSVVSPGTELSRDDYYHRLRHTVLVACLGLLLTLLVLVFAVVGFVLHRRHRQRLAARNLHHLHLHPSQKMNNSQPPPPSQDAADKSKGGVGRIELLQPHHHHRYLDFATSERTHVQRNINHTNNLKNVEKCPNQKQGVLFWNAGGLDAGVATTTVSSPSDSLDSSSRRTNRGKTDNADTWDTWKHQSDGTLSEQVPTNVASGSLHYLSQYPTIFNDATIATEV